MTHTNPALDHQHKHGQIIKEYGQTFLVEADHKIYECFSRKNLPSLTVGDYVTIELADNLQHQPVIIERLARESVLMRRDRYHPQKELAANLTQVMIVLAVIPKTSELYLDQYLAAAELAKLSIIIVLNKIDLLTDHQDIAWLNDYEAMGYPLIKISVKDASNITTLTQHLHHQATLMLGASGVGKSSLLNLLTDNNARTNVISMSNQKGQHTTSACTLYHLPSGGELYDAPGIREFKLVAAQQPELIHGFRDFKPYLGHCKFRNCQHINEPDCALKNAFAAGKISATRFKNYFRMLEAD